MSVKNGNSKNLNDTDLHIWFDESELVNGITDLNEFVSKRISECKEYMMQGLQSFIKSNNAYIQKLNDELKSAINDAGREELLKIIANKEQENNDYNARVKIISQDINGESRPRYKIHLLVRREEIFKYSEKFKEICKALAEVCKTDIINIEVSEVLNEQGLDAPISYSYTSEEFKKLLQFYKQVNIDAINCGHEKIGMYFSDSVTTNRISFVNHLSIGNVCRMNIDIDKICNYIREKEFTPYEAMIYIHNYLTSFTYNEGESEYEHYIAQTIVGPLLTNNKNIICAGFSSLCKAIIDRLNMPGLSCEFQPFLSFNLTNGEPRVVTGHTICAIKIKDEKYNIDGEYHNDASDDSSAFTSYGRFTRFLYPKMDNNFLKNGKEPSARVETPESTRADQVYGATKTKLDEYIKTIKERDEKYIAKNEEELKALKSEFKPLKINQLIVGLYNVLEKCPEIKIKYGIEKDTIKVVIARIVFATTSRSRKVYQPEALNEYVQILKQNNWYEDGSTDNYVRAFIKDTVEKIVNKLEQETSDRDAYGR